MKKIILTGTLILCLFSFNEDSTTYKQVNCDKYFQYQQNRQLTELKEFGKLIQIDHEINEISTAIAAGYLLRVQKLIAVSSGLAFNYHATFKEEMQPFQRIGTDESWCKCTKKLQ